MPGRKTWVAVALLGAPAAATIVRRRVRAARGRRRVDVYFADGSMVSFGEESPEGARLLALGRRALAVARTPS
jgi:hypothetical protein